MLEWPFHCNFKVASRQEQGQLSHCLEWLRISQVALLAHSVTMETTDKNPTEENNAATYFLLNSEVCELIGASQTNMLPTISTSVRVVGRMCVAAPTHSKHRSQIQLVARLFNLPLHYTAAP